MNPDVIGRFAWGGVAAAVLLLVAALLAPEPGKAQQTGQINCSQSMQYDGTANGSTRIFTANPASSARVFICDIFINVGATATNVQVRTGTGTNCGTNTANLTPLFVLPVAGQAYFGGGIWQGITGAGGQDVCIFTSAGNPVQAVISYTYQN